MRVTKMTTRILPVMVLTVFLMDSIFVWQDRFPLPVVAAWAINLVLTLATIGAWQVGYKEGRQSSKDHP